MTATDPLYNFQSDAITSMVKGDQVYLGFDPGLGKSRTALEGAARRGAKRVLVICHASGRYVWEKETLKWSTYQPTIVRGPADLKGNGVKIVTYGLISVTGSPLVKALKAGADWDVTILDEAAALKNHSSNRTKAILGTLLTRLGYVIPLSGTPAPNHAGELFPILQALFPKALANGSGGLLTRWQFEDRFCKVKLKRFGGGQPIRVIEGSQNVPDLRKRIDGFMLRVRKEMVLKDLPPVRYDVVPIGVDSTLAATLPNFPGLTDDEDLLKFLATTYQGEHVMRLRRIMGALKITPSVEFIDDFMEGLPEGRKVLVFAHHKEVIAGLMSGLADYNPVKIDGGSSPVERTIAITSFLHNPKVRIFVGNIQAAGTGLTLVGPTCLCSDVFFVEASYAVGDNVQAAARVHRIGQQDAVVARFLTAHGTLDDRIQAILARKAKDFSALFN